MNKRIVFFAAVLTMALVLVPGVSHARWMNANTGRFQTMDSYEGDQQDPQTLHRYTYAQDDPVNKVDPSGEDVESLTTISTLTTLDQFALPSLAAVVAAGQIPLPPLPISADGQLLLGLVYAESSSKGQGGGENDQEKTEIGLTALNRVYYAKESMKLHHNYNKEFGNGTLLGAISYNPPKQFVGYMSRQWNQVMDGNQLKPKPVLEKITSDNRQHLVLSIQAAAYANNGNPPPPTGLADFQYFPIAFNTTGHDPSPARMITFIKLGGTTFYTFKPGREFR